MALSHLHHFCSSLQAGPYVDQRPQFSFHEDAENQRITCEVTLPIVIAPEIRTARSATSWKTEREARKDAAFQAYVRLYNNGLVNDNLLPHRKSLEEQLDLSKTAAMAPLALCQPRKNMWVRVAHFMKNNLNDRVWEQHRIDVTADGANSFSMDALSPVPLPEVPVFKLHWNSRTLYTVSVTRVGSRQHHEDEIHVARELTQVILEAVYESRMSRQHSDFPLLFVPTGFTDHHHSSSELTKIVDHLRGKTPATSVKVHNRIPEHLYGQHGLLVRHRRTSGSRYLFKHFLPDSDELVVSKFPKRRDFLRKRSEADDQEAYTSELRLEIDQCQFDNLPSEFAIFAAFVPSILRRLELAMLADDLRLTLLAPVEIKSLHLVQTAITQRNASECENYERLEFLGDCILKYCTCTLLMQEQLLWPEYYLTLKKDVVVSNMAQATICQETGLARYIVTDAFKGAKWRPLYAQQLLDAAKVDETRLVQVSTKTLADVVESLIGASFVDGGMPAALRCIRLLFTTEEWLSIEDATRSLRENASSDTDLHLEKIETLTGYSFQKKSLLREAITHPSYSSSQLSTSRPYDRLEFLGDAVLEFIVSKKVFAYQPQLSVPQLHNLRSAIVSTALLSFLCLDFYAEESVNRLIRDQDGDYTVEAGIVKRSLWGFMRYTGKEITNVQQAALKMYEEMKEEIHDALRHDDRFPWHRLAYFGNGARKFFADMIESVLAAIFIDSLGNLDMCEAFLERISLLPLLVRLLEDGVECSHPKCHLGVLAASKRVVYHTSQMQDKRWASFVAIGGQATGVVAMGFSRDEAETRAAAAACEMFGESEEDEIVEMDLDETVVDEGGTYFDLEISGQQQGSWKFWSPSRVESLS